MIIIIPGKYLMFPLLDTCINKCVISNLLCIQKQRPLPTVGPDLATGLAAGREPVQTTMALTLTCLDHHCGVTHAFTQ